ncbi:flavodoxin II [Colwellia chukchiensis]|uniref:Flavodoxin n=1 Tax=Colwellia chukchiensis TaxID=641665 RepID=A0A1H7IVU2_9GAMM|nr:flavodoxin FldB [Colwellia chukchiensis]SEK66569.1 flavodoxin II [Colwellia chukchiensis]
MNIALFYGSTTCYTEIAAEKIQAQLGEHKVELFNIKDTPLATMANHDILILGISTWDYGEIQEDWESHWPEIANIDLEGKIIALYGMGDQIGYTDWFQDALGMLHEQVLAQGGYVIGYWPNQGYEFAASKALTTDQQHFVGLALDEDNQYQLSDERIETWCQQISQEIAEILA